MTVLGPVHEHVFKSMMFSGPCRLSLVGPAGSGRTYLANSLIEGWGRGQVLSQPDMMFPAQIVVSERPPALSSVYTWNFYTLTPRPVEAVRSVLLTLLPYQRREYGLKYLSPVMADWAAPLSRGSVDRALRLLAAKNLSHSLLTSLIYAVNTGNLVEFGRVQESLTHSPALLRALRLMLAAWVVSEIHPDSPRVLEASARHLSYPIPELLRSLKVLEETQDDSAAVFLACWPLLAYQRGSA